MRPIVVGEIERGVRCVLQRIVVLRHAARFDVADFRPDRNHGVAKPVEFRLRFRFRRFDHQCAGHREAHRRRVEAVVDQPLGNIVD